MLCNIWLHSPKFTSQAYSEYMWKLHGKHSTWEAITLFKQILPEKFCFLITLHAVRVCGSVGSLRTILPIKMSWNVNHVIYLYGHLSLHRNPCLAFVQLFWWRLCNFHSSKLENWLESKFLRHYNTLSSNPNATQVHSNYIFQAQITRIIMS